MLTVMAPHVEGDFPYLQSKPTYIVISQNGPTQNGLMSVDERWKTYTDVTIGVAMLQEVHANQGSDNVAVVDYPKMWNLTGQFLDAGDQV